MARIYSFPDGEMIEDTGDPTPKVDAMLEFVKSSPVEAAGQLAEISTKFNHVVNTILSIHKFCNTRESEECKRVVNMIELNLHIEGAPGE